jgi:porin
MDAQGLAGTIKFGGWYHFGPFNDYHFGIDGRSLADPLSNTARPSRRFRRLWRNRSDALALPAKVKKYWRIRADSGSPSDRNLMNFYAEAGSISWGFGRTTG